MSDTTAEAGAYKRPKGFVSWNPHKKTLVILAQVLEILEMYEAQRPLTARQIFYRLVGAYEYDKTELAYNRLCEYLVRARRSGMIPFDWIRDDGTAMYKPAIPWGIDGFYGTRSYLDYEVGHLVPDRYRRDRLSYQGYQIEVWCEAAGMAPQLVRVARPYGASVYSTGGFSSVTVTHEVAQRVVREPRPTIFLHIGDLDPSGQSIYEAMSEDIDTFVSQLKGIRERHPDDERWEMIEEDCEFIYHRVALTEEQVEEYALPTAPPKSSDRRTRNWIGETCQAEAMAPDDLAEILDASILNYIDMDVHRNVLEVEGRDKAELLDLLTPIQQNSENEEI